MALFQPTNITPDLKGGVKNGVVLIPAGVITPTSADISWSVNGNSKMTAYQIDFYQNTAASTLTGSTGKITLGTPFSAVSADGTETRFTATVAWSLISGAYSGTGTLQGKFKITQWWGTGANDYVEQRSLSVFEVSKEGGVTILPPTGYGGYLDFNAIYSHPAPSSTYGDVPLNWIRWEIFTGSADGTPIHDTGKVWNATSYAWSPPVLSPAYYVARFTAEGANGAEYLDVRFFSVSQSDITTIEDMLTVQCDHANDAVKIILDDRISLVDGDAYGSVSYGTNNKIIISNYTSGISFNVLEYSKDAWSFIWHGTIDGTGGTVFRIRMKSGEDVKVAQNSGRLYFTTGTTSYNMAYSTNREYWIIFTIGFFTEGRTDGFQWLVYSPEVSGYSNWPVTTFSQSVPKSIDLYGPCTVYDFQLGFGTGNSSLEGGMDDNTYVPEFKGPKVTYPYNGASAVWLPFGVSSPTSALYRTEDQYAYGAAMTLIGNFPPYIDETWIPYILDYTAVNGQQYQYVVTSADEDLENEALSKSGTVTPCFWNWLLIEAKQDANNKDLYKVQQDFRFIGNVSSGSYSNGGSRNIQPTFTQYSAVFRSTQNRRQGTLTGLIGYTVMGEYFDFNATEQAIRALSTSKNQLFLRDRRGNFMKIALAGEISMSVNDNSAKQEITANIPWIESGSAAGVSVYDTGYIDTIDPEPDPPDDPDEPEE